MSKMDDFNDPEDEVVENAMAICNCLEYLQRETQRLELPYAAHLIGLALEAIVDSVSAAGDGEADDMLSAAGAGSGGRPH